QPQISIQEHPKPLTLKLESNTTTKTADADPLLPKFHPISTGPIVFTLADNIKNHGICPGTGVVLVVGKNFTTGFSQGQATTTLRNAGIPLIMSASVGRIFERDAIVNGLICLESFKLVSFLIKKFNVLSKGGFTLVTRPDLSLDSRAGIVTISNPSGQILSKPAVFHLQPISISVQDHPPKRLRSQWRFGQMRSSNIWLQTTRNVDVGVTSGGFDFGDTFFD
ncbi:hypothetical protein PSHT_11735, partial [Puccinia striiformis]